MTAISITSMLSEKHAMNRAHPEAVNERLRMITFLVTSEPEKYLKNRWELKRMAIMEALDLTPREYGYTTEAINREAKAKRDSEILRMHGDGLSGRAIAKELGLNNKTVSNVIRRHLDD
ncbi:LuxR C-terminal-related transcriptional regulator [Aeromonas allosaccharophila]|uniref:LuxR C-terminal-related transcriptional regulator n=1 Tax=Aeromonas allosaccharophila TaxID=656 RepID=UPI003D1CB7AC